MCRPVDQATMWPDLIPPVKLVSERGSTRYELHTAQDPRDATRVRVTLFGVNAAGELRNLAPLDIQESRQLSEALPVSIAACGEPVAQALAARLKVIQGDLG